MTNRKRLARYLKWNIHENGQADPLRFTKSFLRKYNIPEKKFFIWVMWVAEPFGYSINNDKDVMTLLQ